jgi:hypothetical protein
MPGITGWDISFFSKYPQIAEIHAVEKDKDIADMLALHNTDPKVSIYNTTVSQFLYDQTCAPTPAARYDIIYLDYCSMFTLQRVAEIDMILHHKLIGEGGQIVANYLGARESRDNTINYKMLCDIAEHVTGIKRSNTLTTNGIRKLAFNGMLLRHLISPSVDNHYTYTTIPEWFSYRNHVGMMMNTVSFRVVDYTPSRPAPGENIEEDSMFIDVEKFSVMYGK